MYRHIFYNDPVIYRRGQKESDELLYTFWSLVMVRNQLPAQVVKVKKKFFFFFHCTLIFPK